MLARENFLPRSLWYPCSLTIIAPAILIGDLFAAESSIETGMRSALVKPADRKPFIDHKQDWAPESVITLTLDGLIHGAVPSKITVIRG